MGLIPDALYALSLICVYVCRVAAYNYLKLAVNFFRGWGHAIIGLSKFDEMINFYNAMLTNFLLATFRRICTHRCAICSLMNVLEFRDRIGITKHSMKHWYF